jgi:hypothetical protein
MASARLASLMTDLPYLTDEERNIIRKADSYKAAARRGAVR